MSATKESEVKKILIVDDEKAIVENLSAFLSRSGFTTETATNGLEGLEKVASQQPDVIVLDVMMPELDGRQMLRRMREDNNWTPVILLTQIGDAPERAMAISEGADDYLNKPYDPHELVARINAIVRRSNLSANSLSSTDVLIAGDLKYDRKARIASLAGNKLYLTPRGTHLLEYLMLHPNELLHRERILDAVWGWNFVTGTRSVDARIVELRKALAEHSDIIFIETVPSEGYRFLPKVN